MILIVAILCTVIFAYGLAWMGVDFERFSFRPQGWQDTLSGLFVCAAAGVILALVCWLDTIGMVQ